MARYLARLPGGIEAYPECVVRAPVLRTFSESRSLRGFRWNDVHSKVARVLRTALSPNDWVSDVTSTATVLAIADHHRMSDDELREWFRQENTRLLNSPKFAPLLSLASPELLIRSSATAWGVIRRGTGFGARIREGGADVTLTFPPFMHPEEVLLGLGHGMCSAFSMSRAQHCTMQIVRSTPRSCVYGLDWKV